MQDWLAPVGLLLVVALILLLAGPRRRKPGDRENKGMQGRLNEALRRMLSDKDGE